MKTLLLSPLALGFCENDPYGFPIHASEKYFGQTGLKCDSCVKWTKLITISAQVVARKLGKLPPEVLQSICDRIKGIFS